MRRAVSVLCLSALSLPGCFVALEAGVATPVSGPVEKSLTTSLGFAIGFAADFGVGLVAAGTGVVIHEVTRDSGEVDEIANMGPHFRTDLTLYHDPMPLIDGGNFGTVYRATSTLRLGGCRKLDIDGANPMEQCSSVSDAKLGDGLLVSMGALAGIRTDTGNTLSLSLSPYYTRSNHPTEETVALGGVMARIALSGIPKMFSGVATLFEGYDYEASIRQRESDAAKNKRRGDAMRCKGVLKQDSKGKTYCDE